MQEEIRIEHFTLSINGLKVRYKSSLGKTTIVYDSFTTCILLQELDIIEGVDLEGDEPIILYTQNDSYGGCHWYEFVKNFPFNELQAKRVAEHHYQKSVTDGFPVREKVKATPLLLREVTPPLRLYHIHQYYRTNISTSKK